MEDKDPFIYPTYSITAGARASVAMLLTQFSWNILSSGSEGLTDNGSQAKSSPTVSKIAAPDIINVTSHEYWGISNHTKFTFKLTSKKTSKFCITGPLWGESTGDRWLPSQRYTEAISISWHHHEFGLKLLLLLRLLSVTTSTVFLKKLG